MEKGRRLFRHPLCWIRPSLGYELVTVTPSETNSDNAGSSADVIFPVQQIIDSEKVISTLGEHCEWMDETLFVEEKETQNPELRIDRRNEWIGQQCADYEEPFDRGDTSLVMQGNAEVNLTEDQEDELISASDPSRLHPKVFLKVPRCIAAIEKEMTDLTTCNSVGIPSLAPIRLDDSRYSSPPLTHTTMIVRRENLAIFKARLCIRGDEIHHIGEFDTSAPTAARISPRILIMISRIFQRNVGILDVSQAFLQADLISPKDRVRLIPPYYVNIPWKGSVNLSAERYCKPKWGVPYYEAVVRHKMCTPEVVSPHFKCVHSQGMEPNTNGSMRVQVGERGRIIRNSSDARGRSDGVWR